MSAYTCRIIQYIIEYYIIVINVLLYMCTPIDNKITVFDFLTYISIKKSVIKIIEMC